ncbi:hypothetical protein PIB30_092101 [Stylosanthes scabra]|uniref:Zinc finger GRF-type domain-containing protein n=1 Tax=Stylosanthes scabra TaxID=79078 RepID=A0ABU6WVU8_9FABA|nr:hypothetical protein [Stylosanthes scabra]
MQLCGRPIVEVFKDKRESGPQRTCINYDIGRGCNFFTWADGDGEATPHEAEIARLKMKLSALKAKLAYANCKLLIVINY